MSDRQAGQEPVGTPADATPSGDGATDGLPGDGLPGDRPVDEPHDQPHDRGLAGVVDDALADPEPLSGGDLRRAEPHPFNVPNAVTFLRALLVPVILWLLASGDTYSRWWVFSIFLFAALTDSIDGWVARRWHGVTSWGQLADPIADKLLIIGSLASLATVGELPWWAVWVIVFREVAVTVMRVGLVRRRDLVLPASILGKVKTVVQVLAVLAFLMPGVGTAIRFGALWAAVVATIVSGLDYARHVAKLSSPSTS